MNADYVNQALKGIKESFDNGGANDILKYMTVPIFNFENTSEFQEIFTSTEGLTGSKELTESETPPTLKLEDGYAVTLTDKRFGGAIEVTETDTVRMKDSTTLIDKYIQRQRNQLLKNNRHLFLRNVYNLLNDAFTGATYLAPDGDALISDSHTWNSGGTFDNKSTAALTQTAWDALMEYGGAFTDPAGEEWPIDFDTIIVKKGSANETMAKKLFAFGINPTAINDINIYEGTVRIIATPYITTANKLCWFALDSKMESPLYVGINKMPGLNEPIRQNNEAIRTNCTGYYKVGINNMPFCIYGSTGAA